ncbi:hypothetical protein M080_7987, partial [Bacteroides fragilis str. 3397 T10]
NVAKCQRYALQTITKYRSSKSSGVESGSRKGGDV